MSFCAAGMTEYALGVTTFPSPKTQSPDFYQTTISGTITPRTSHSNPKAQLMEDADMW